MKARGTAFLAGALLGAVYLAAALSVILTGRGQGSPAASDQALFHLPTIKLFERQWPRFDFDRYPSATTPGYHVVMATLHLAGADVRALRIVTALITAGLLATLAAAVARRTGLATGLALCLPFAASPYVFTAGTWLAPHNAAWWWVLGVLLLALRPRIDRWTYAAGGLLLLAIVLVRQIHLWAAAPLLAAAWLGGDDDSELRDAARGDATPRLKRLMATALALVPAVAALAWFAARWRGLTPPGEEWATRGVRGINAIVPATVLAVLGIFGVFFAGFLPRDVLGGLRRPGRVRAWALTGLLLGAVIGLLPRSNYDADAGRWGGLWSIVRRLPTVLDRSPLIVALAALGGLLLALWLAALPRRPRRVLLAALAGFVAAHMAVGQAWQRYYDPFVLMLLPLAAASTGTSARAGGRWAALGPFALAASLAAVTAMSLRT